jgi:PAS domain S-box-containing protein
MMRDKKHARQISSRIRCQENNSRAIIDRDITQGKYVYSMEARIKILYVDDEPDLLEIGRLFLEGDNGNFQVFTSSSARDALESLQNLPYDIIISDYQMSGMDGIALLKEVRNRYGDIPFILFTGRGREEVVIEAINNGADFYLQKGGDPTAQFAELAHKIRQAVGRKRAELSLVESEKRLSDIIDFLPDATFAIDKSGKVIAWNHAIEEMTRISAAEMLGKGDFEYAIPLYGTRRKILIDLILGPDEIIDRDYTHISREKDALNADTTLPRPLGKTVTVMGKASPLYNRLGEVVGAIESVRDITEREKSETELRAAYEQLAASGDELRSQYKELALAHEKLWESRQQLSDIAEMVPGVVYQFFVHPDGSREATYISTRAPEVFCIRNDTDRVLERFTEHVDPRDREAFLHSIQESISSESPWNFEGRFIRPDGKNIWFQGISQPLKKESVLVYNGVLMDITERKTAEETLRENELRFRTIFEKTHNPFLILSDGGFTDCNQAALSLFGYSLREEFTGLRPRDLSPAHQPDGRDSGLAEEDHVRTALEQGSDQFIWTHTRKDGSTFIADIILSACELAGNQSLFTSIRDISRA